MQNWDLKPARDLQLPARQRHRHVWRESGLIETVLRFAWWSSVRASLTVFHSIEFHGREHTIREPPFLIVSNHESHLDALVIGAALPLRLRDRMFPLAAGDVFFETPAVAAFAALALNALPVWRRQCGRHGLADLRSRLLEEQCVYILFPEGTRTRDGEMGRFRPGVGALVAGTSTPVVPCYLDGAFEAFPPSRRLPRLKKISASFGPAMSFEDTENHRSGWNSIATRLESAVRAIAASRSEAGHGGRADRHAAGR
jgi:1-acyl-sn-glycerol-3-phosphate acyltransferase